MWKTALVLAAALGASAARAMDFAPCTDPGHERFDCATLDAVPTAMVVVVPHQGHSVGTGARCARDAMAAFLGGDVVDTAICANRQALQRPTPRPPRRLRRVVVPAGYPPGEPGRLLAATVGAVRDALAVGDVAASHVPGMRAGSAERVMPDPTTRGFALHGWTWVPGVALDGLAFYLGAQDVPVADVTVRLRGGRTGAFTWTADGRLRLELDGRSYEAHVDPDTTPVRRDVAERAEVLPPIP